jgi:hypothetical protein
MRCSIQMLTDVALFPGTHTGALERAFRKLEKLAQGTRKMGL